MPTPSTPPSPLLLSEATLRWSSVVANNSMNRRRQAGGPNSYEKDLQLHPVPFLTDVLARQGHAAWLDLCCGEGRALLQTATHFQSQGQADAVELVGLDLVDAFAPGLPGSQSITFCTGAVLDWPFTQSFDLITCVHGLHYLGDKLAAIGRAAAALRPGGLFVANLALSDIVVQGADARRLLPRWLAAQGFQYDARRRLLRRTGPAQPSWPLRYLGADDAAGPNYTGQPVVTSYYERLMA